MISISGINYQRELEELPYFNKQTASTLIGKSGKNLDAKLLRLSKKDYLIRLKKGLYVTSSYIDKEPEKGLYFEYIANILRYPSYLSLEYVLALYNLIPEAVYNLTSITLKSTRTYSNSLGVFIYKNIKQRLFTGYKEKSFGKKTIYIATKTKALFDYLYLKRNLGDYQYELQEGLRINWDLIKDEDRQELYQYIELSGSAKMKTIMKVIKKL